MTVRAPAGADSGSILTFTMRCCWRRSVFESGCRVFGNVLGLMSYMPPNEILVFKRYSYQMIGWSSPWWSSKTEMSGNRCFEHSNGVRVVDLPAVPLVIK